MVRFAKRAFLSFGSNLGDRAALIEQAIQALNEAGIQVRKRSLLYETEPVGVHPQRWFLNCLVEVETELMPLGLLRVLKRLERQLGRRPVSGREAAARSIDIDIVAYGQHVVEMPELTVPHPRLAERRFVLEPLRELAPDWRHPVTRQTPAEMLAALGTQSAVRLWRSRD